MIGRPYRVGGDSPATGFDCSGLVYYCYRVLGFELPRTVDALRAATVPVARGQLAVGDLLFFQTGPNRGHVGIYYGDDRFVHAPSSGKTVMRSRLDDPYWRAHLREARRLHVESQPGSDSSPRTSSGVPTSAGNSAAVTGALSRNP